MFNSISSDLYEPNEGEGSTFSEDDAKNDRIAVRIKKKVSSRSDSPKTRQKGQGKPRAFSSVYSVRIGDKKEAFASLHGVSCKRIENIASHISHNNAVTLKPEGRGKHKTRLNQVAEETVKMVHDHIPSFPTRESHYIRKDNVQRIYLPVDLDITQMHKLT
ncbi:hypothetical protein ANN_14156 [Periplaneta americana]|uniref:Uncharacterized protein n=1 Tax=Periplaneta americana TaxID=6978 RepID=A0ABQ8SX10_PERAM|nr:hypothetical protein ANN_14156 [Periplaneta americana]